jgi:hypothetical protein
MPRFFFDRYEDGQFFQDEEGVDEADVRLAEMEAARAAFDLAEECLQEGITSVKINLRDDEELILSLEVTSNLERRG